MFFEFFKTEKNVRKLNMQSNTQLGGRSGGLAGLAALAAGKTASKTLK